MEQLTWNLLSFPPQPLPYIPGSVLHTKELGGHGRAVWSVSSAWGSVQQPRGPLPGRSWVVDGSADCWSCHPLLVRPKPRACSLLLV